MKIKKIGSKILIGFLLAALVPMITIAVITENIAEKAIEKYAHNEFEAIRDIKKKQIETFFSERGGDIRVLTFMTEHFYSLPGGINQAINEKNDEGKNFFESYMEEYGYYGLFLIDPKGYIFYSAAKEADYQTNLMDGPYSDSNLADLFREAMGADGVHVVDFAAYAPSNGDPASFIAKQVHDEHANIIGIVALQIPLDPINRIMQTRSGMGETGETYLVGSDFLMRSDSYLDPTNHSVLASFKNPEKGSVKTEGVRNALAGQTGVKTIIDYNGNPVISAYAPLEMNDLNWVILSEIDVAEAFIPVYEMQQLAVIIAVIIAIVIVIVALMFARSISRPVIALTSSMNEVGTNFDFSKKCSVNSVDEIGQAAHAFNELLDSTKEAINEVNSTMGDIAQGKFNGRITADLKGDLGVLKENVNASADSVEFTMNELGKVMNAISDGNFSARMDEKIPGEFRKRVDQAMNSMDTAVREIGTVITKLSEGEFDGRISANLKGDMDKLKQNVNRSVEQLETGMTEMISAIVSQSQGDLTVQVNGNYQGELKRLKDAFNEGAEKLNSAILKVMNSAQKVSEASQEVASGSSDLNERTQSQAASLEETASAMEELTSTIKNNTDNARQADQLSTNSRNQAQQGQAVMQETIDAIAQISESSQQIQEIISLIDSIAFQTNLLALNAAVEAARAGEHGRGFAVVAGEVRNLAGKSADAAKDIKDLIDRSAQSIKLGSEKIDRTSEVLEEINHSIQQVGSIVSEIAAASEEQQIGVEQVNQAVSQIDQTTQQNAALVEETTAAAESMNDESETLRKTVSSFKTRGGRNLPQ